LKPWSSRCEDYEYGLLRCETTVWYVCTTIAEASSVCVFREEERGKIFLQNIGTYLWGLITLNRQLARFIYETNICKHLIHRTTNSIPPTHFAGV
jgi:hypothetical protein